MIKSMERMMRMFIACLAITVSRVNYAIAVAPTEDIDVVTKLAEFRLGGGKKNLDRLLETFEKKAVADPYINWLRIKPVLESPDVLSVVKTRTFSVVLETADAQTVKSMVAAAAQWCRLTNLSTQIQSQRSNTARLCDALLSKMATNENWRSWAAPEPTLRAFLVHSRFPRIDEVESTKEFEIATVLSDVPLDDFVKSGIVEEIILLSPRGSVYRVLYSFLNTDSITKVRDELRLSIKGDGYLHFGAIRALVEIGDLATLPILANQAEIRASLPPRRADAWIAKWTEKIKAQHPPSQLLQWIADPARATTQTYSDALWAMQRASDLGMDPELIRLAVLQLADNARHTTKAALLLPSMKKAAMRLGVLHPDDLKDVVIPSMNDIHH